ncbi:hypothetical protein V494_02276 [Pseudogymnoascus sp. VKM F-4513 (FW-928)]|nr:hypothetical protein V494_02276 [Pseudogymnoascus sp. VKM F-4513 (FW-928)]
MHGIYTIDNAVTMEVTEYGAVQCSTNGKKIALAFPMANIACKAPYRAWIKPDMTKYYYYRSPTYALTDTEIDVHMKWLDTSKAQFWANLYCDCGGYQCKGNKNEG